MGSAASAPGEVPGADLRLPTTGLKFSVNQLRSLNAYVDTLYDEDQKGRMSIEVESAVESLVQRIVDGAGQKDPRFRCSHIIALHRGKKMRSRSLEYLITLDALPVLNSGEECRLQDGPVGYGKIRLTGRDADKWEEFLTPSGYLCRDKVVERWVELIARCATARGGGGARVLSARAAAHAQPYQYCYLERATPYQPATDRRLAIVEGAAWVMVRAGGGAEAKLVLGARAHGGSPDAYTSRVPLTHPLAPLHYTAQGDYYAAAVGPPSSVVCADRSSIWQLWHPALEEALDAHWSDLATVARVATALNALIDKMREGCYQGTLRVVSRYMAGCALRRRLDRCASLTQPYGRAFVSAHASHHLLLILDELVSVCERGGAAGYVWGTGRGAVVRRGARDAAWPRDAACLRACLQHLHAIAGNEEIPPTTAESLELILFNRWENLNKEHKSSGTTYSRRQLRYLRRAADLLLRCKSLLVCDNHSNFRANLIQATAQGDELVEELIHILAIMLDQARDLYLNNFHSHTFGDLDRDLSTYRSKKWNKLKEYYDASSACLIDAVRRDPDLRREDLKDPINMMKNILNWLHKGAKDDKKYLGPVLKPYLDGLFKCSLENAWFLEDFESKTCEKELEGLKEFCAGVHDGKLEPCNGLLEAAKKLVWAKALVDFVNRFRHVDFRLVFPTGDGMAISFPVKLPSRRELCSARALTLSRRDKAEAKTRLARRCVLGAFTAALVGDRRPQPKAISRHESEEILASVKTGRYWRSSTKPDVIPPAQDQETSELPKVRRRSKRRPATAYGFPEISITNDTKTMRRKYHTLKSLVYTEEVESIKQLRERPRSAGSTVRHKEVLTRPSILETLDFINSVKDALCVEESGASDAEEQGWSSVEEWAGGLAAPLNVAAARGGVKALHALLGDLLPALLQRGRFTILQELCCYLGESSEGALFALHRLARAARSRSSERASNSWRLPELEGSRAEAPQQYRARPPDYQSGDEGPPPPPLPRTTSRTKVTAVPPHYQSGDEGPPPPPLPRTTSRTKVTAVPPHYQSGDEGPPPPPLPRTTSRTKVTAVPPHYQSGDEGPPPPPLPRTTSRTKVTAVPPHYQSGDEGPPPPPLPRTTSRTKVTAVPPHYQSGDEGPPPPPLPRTTSRTKVTAVPPHYQSGDEGPPPPPLPRTTSRTKVTAVPPHYQSGDEGPPPPPLPRTTSRTKVTAVPPHYQSGDEGPPPPPLPRTTSRTKVTAVPPHYQSGDEGPPPPPLPRTTSRTKIPQYKDFNPPPRLQQQDNQLTYLEPASRKLPATNKQLEYTGIINPIYDIKFPRDKFRVKRSKSLGRSFSSKNLGLEITRYNLTLGHKSGKKTNDVVTAITGMTGETGLEPKSNFFQRYTTAEVVGDSYKISRVTID